MQDHRPLDLCGPRLRPCEGCGGMADYAYADGTGWIVARCTKCGRQTGTHADTGRAGMDWNYRISNNARVVTLSQLWDLAFDMGDDNCDVAVWLEGRGGSLRAAVLAFGIDHVGDAIVREIGPGRDFTWSRKDIQAEGQLYRLWDKKPTKAERVALDWDRPMWKDARQLIAEAKVREALERAKEGERK